MFINTASLSAKLARIKIVHNCSCLNSFELESCEPKPNHNGTSKESSEPRRSISSWLGLPSWAHDLQFFYSSIQWFTDNWGS